MTNPLLMNQRVLSLASLTIMRVSTSQSLSAWENEGSRITIAHSLSPLFQIDQDLIQGRTSSQSHLTAHLCDIVDIRLVKVAVLYGAMGIGCKETIVEP